MYILRLTAIVLLLLAYLWLCPNRSSRVALSMWTLHLWILKCLLIYSIRNRSSTCRILLLSLQQLKPTLVTSGKRIFLLQEPSIDILTTAILNFGCTAYSMCWWHLNTLQTTTLFLLENRCQHSYYVWIRKKVLNQHFLVLCFKVIKCNRFYIQISFCFWCSSIIY